MNDPLLATVADTDDAERFLADEAPEVETIDAQIENWWRSLDLPPATEDLHTAARLHTITRRDVARACVECAKPFTSDDPKDYLCDDCFMKSFV